MKSLVILDQIVHKKSCFIYVLPLLALPSHYFSWSQASITIWGLNSSFVIATISTVDEKVKKIINVFPLLPYTWNPTGCNVTAGTTTLRPSMGQVRFPTRTIIHPKFELSWVTFFLVQNSHWVICCIMISLFSGAMPN